MYYVYLLKSTRDDKYYFGQTDNIERRLNEHNLGRVKATKNRRPLILIGYEEQENRSKAMWREKEIKKSAHKRYEFINKLIGKNIRS